MHNTDNPANATATINGTRFAGLYLAAVGAMLDAMAHSTAERWQRAFDLARAASNAGHGDTESELAQSLARNIRDSAPAFGMYGLN